MASPKRRLETGVSLLASDLAFFISDRISPLRTKLKFIWELPSSMSESINKFFISSESHYFVSGCDIGEHPSRVFRLQLLITALKFLCALREQTPIFTIYSWANHVFGITRSQVCNVKFTHSLRVCRRSSDFIQ